MSKRLAVTLTVIAVLNVIAGFVMWMLDRGQYGSPMIVIGLGALAAIGWWYARPD